MTDSKLRIAILSRAHLRAHSYAAALRADDHVEFVGIWDDDADAGAEFARQYAAPFFTDRAELLGQALDGVIVTSETFHHPALTIAAAEAGVGAILCEKPIAVSLDDAHSMIDVCAEHGAKLASAFPCRFSPVFQRLKASVDGGRLGKVLAIRATNHGKCPGGWFIQPEKSGGGAIIDHTGHVADLTRVLLGTDAVAVYAEQGNNMYHQSNWEDCGMLSITYENGVFATLDTSWSRPPKSFCTWGDVTMDIVGEAGNASIDLFRQAATQYSEADGGAHQLGWGSSNDSGMVGEFLAMAAGRQAETLATGEDGLKALEVALAAYESAKTHQTVTLQSESAAS